MQVCSSGGLSLCDDFRDVASDSETLERRAVTVQGFAFKFVSNERLVSTSRETYHRLIHEVAAVLQAFDGAVDRIARHREHDG